MAREGSWGESDSRVRPMDRTDLDFAARLHLSALPHGFFPRLGGGFMRAYYRSFSRSPHATALVSMVGGERAGVLVGTVDDYAHYRLLARRPWGLAPAALVALAARPRVAGWFLRTRVRRYARGLVRFARSSSPAPATPSAFEGRSGALTHLAVAAPYRSSGVGRSLVDEFVRSARAHGTMHLRVTTLADGKQAVGFYEALGWETVGTRHDADQQTWLDLRLNLD